MRLGPNYHGNGDYDEILMVEKQALENEKVKAEIAKLKLPEGTVVCADPWIYGKVSHLPGLRPRCSPGSGPYFGVSLIGEPFVL